jgi:uncharacterized protein YkwD
VSPHLPSNRCDFCGGEFRFQEQPRKDVNGRFYTSSGEYYPPFQCTHCGGYFCHKHRLPENHGCNHIRRRDIVSEPVNTFYEGRRRKQKIASYAKTAVLLSVLVIAAYAALNTTLLSNVNSFIQSQVPVISSAISSVGETVTRTVTPTPVSTSDIERLIFKYTNDERKKAGLKELIWDDQLALIAREHSVDMAKNDFFSHTNLSGEDPTERAQRHGYTIRKPIGGGSYMLGIGENISKMPTGNVEGHGYISNDADSVAKAVVESWISSPGHRANILNQGYDRLGVGVAYDGTYYLSTQDFW